MKKFLFVVILALSVAATTHANIEIRGGLLISAAPDAAVDMFGSGLSWGITVRKEFLPMFKLGIGFDSIFMLQDVKKSELTDSVINSFVDLDSDKYDIDYRMVPIFIEGMLDFPVVYAVAGVGIYPTWIDIDEIYTDEYGEEAKKEIYSKANTRFGTFIGGGLRYDVDGVIVRFGMRYHVLKVHKEIMNNNISAFSADIALELTF